MVGDEYTLTMNTLFKLCYCDEQWNKMMNEKFPQIESVDNQSLELSIPQKSVIHVLSFLDADCHTVASLYWALYPIVPQKPLVSALCKTITREPPIRHISIDSTQLEAKFIHDVTFGIHQLVDGAPLTETNFGYYNSTGWKKLSKRIYTVYRSQIKDMDSIVLHQTVSEYHWGTGNTDRNTNHPEFKIFNRPVDMLDKFSIVINGWSPSKPGCITMTNQGPEIDFSKYGLCNLGATGIFGHLESKISQVIGEVTGLKVKNTAAPVARPRFIVSLDVGMKISNFEDENFYCYDVSGGSNSTIQIKRSITSDLLEEKFDTLVSALHELDTSSIFHV
jgi:hypothetical protein